MIAAKRIACLLAIGLALLATLAKPEPAGASQPPAALINLGELFGDENEPDENEPEEGSKGAAQEEQSSGPSLAVLLLLLVLGLLTARVALWGFRLRRRIRSEGWLAVLLGRRPPARSWRATRTDLRPPPRPRRRRSG